MPSWAKFYFGGVALGVLIALAEAPLLFGSILPVLVIHVPVYGWAAAFGVGARFCSDDARSWFLAAGLAPLACLNLLGGFAFLAAAIPYFFHVPPLILMLIGSDRRRTMPVAAR